MYVHVFRFHITAYNKIMKSCYLGAEILKHLTMLSNYNDMVNQKSNRNA